MTTDFGAAADDYAKYRVGFPDSLFTRLASRKIGKPGKTIVDVGTGTGSLARGFALRGCEAIGIDPDERLPEQARRLDQVAGVSVEYKTGRAEALPLPDAVADSVTAGQCWHWFESDAAAKEFARITKPGGRVVVTHFDWLPLPSTVGEATERLIMKHNSNWHHGGGDGLHVESLPYLQAARFGQFETFSYDIDVSYSRDAWRGRIRASAGIGARLALPEVTAFDDALAELLATSFADEPLQVQHRVFALIGRKEKAR